MKTGKTGKNKILFLDLVLSYDNNYFRTENVLQHIELGEWMNEFMLTLYYLPKIDLDYIGGWFNNVDVIQKKTLQVTVL